MPFRFLDICILLRRLEDIELLDPQPLAADKSAKLKAITQAWFKSHSRAIGELDVEGTASLLSALLPERRTDRVYGIQNKSLCRILSRSLQLGGAGTKDLQAYTSPGRGDLGTCLERVLSAGGPPALPSVSLEEVDKLLHQLAGQCRSSGPEVGALLPSSSEARGELLGRVFKRVSAFEGKWLVRLILKDFSPVQVDQELVLKSYHFLLPVILRFQDNFELAISQLKDPNVLGSTPGHPDPRSEPAYRDQAAYKLRPIVGTKVGRPYFHKARSLDRCLKILGSSPSWVLERKYDGEYCEIHIDLSRSSDPIQCIQIFSKSGKDSTEDRKKVHQTLKQCLRLGEPDCKIERRAILLAELVVFSDQEEEPLPFERLRRHISRSGSFLGTDEDSVPGPGENLGLVFFDLLLLDELVVMHKPIDERRRWLREVHTKQRNALSSEWKVITHDSEDVRHTLVKQFAASIASRCEGLVLKPCSVPYFSLTAGQNAYHQSFTKLEKDYINGAGDEADIAVIGASYDAQQAAKSGLPGIRYTDFLLACLMNQDDVKRFGARPKFKCVGIIRQHMCIPRPTLKAVNTIGQFVSKPFGSPEANLAFDIALGAYGKPEVVLLTPVVFEVLGSGYERAANARHFELRHARVKKLHEDRDWKDCISFQDLQEQAKASRQAPVDSESQETLRWIEKLERGCRRKFERARTVTPRTATTTSPGTGSTRVSVSVKENAIEHFSEIALPAITPCAAQKSSLSLNGTTLVQTSAGAKRASTTESPCLTKRPCPTIPEARSIASGNATFLDPPRASSHNTHSKPLWDITNKILPTSGSGVATLKVARNQTSNAKSLQKRPNQSKKPTNTSLDLAACQSSNCLLSQTVVHLAPCIAKALYITEDLLPNHACTPTQDLKHWDRDAFAYSPSTSIVSESQAYEGLRKAVLVESKRSKAVRDIIEQVEGLNGGKPRERIEVYDWRVLERCRGHGGSDRELKRFLLGATVWDEGRPRSCFVGNPTFGI